MGQRHWGKERSAEGIRTLRGSRVSARVAVGNKASKLVKAVKCLICRVMNSDSSLSNAENIPGKYMVPLRGLCEGDR